MKFIISLSESCTFSFHLLPTSKALTTQRFTLMECLLSGNKHDIIPRCVCVCIFIYVAMCVPTESLPSQHLTIKLEFPERVLYSSTVTLSFVLSAIPSAI